MKGRTSEPLTPEQMERLEQMRQIREALQRDRARLVEFLQDRRSTAAA
jgi:hypothetical protein